MEVYDRVVGLAHAVALMKEYVLMLGMTNQPAELEKRVELSAQYAMANDKLNYAISQYEAAMAEYVKTLPPDSYLHAGARCLDVAEPRLGPGVRMAKE